MTPQVSPGTCLLCRAPVTKRGALKHGMKCLQASGWPTGKKPSLLISIQGRYERNYWLVVLARHDARLGDLDRLIRDVWVECCGHLSSFLVGGVDYDSDDECSTDAMNVPLADLVSPGSTFSYDYDFGSTTSLDLKVIGETPAAPPKGLLCLIARNNRPSIPCDLCGGDAGFTSTDLDEETPCYYCRDCLSSADPETLDTIANSPRNGVCGYAEDPVSALPWYPPGWSADEIVPVELDDETEVNASIALVIQDIGPDIDAFFEAEKAAYGEEVACMAGESVIAFCTFMYTLHGVKIDAWDARSVQRCLVEHLAQNPIFPEDWPENAVPILCRFLKHMEEAGRITNASGLIAALEEAEPAFKEAVMNRQKDQDVFEYLLEKLEDSGIDLDDLGAVANFAMKELLTIAGFDSDDERFHNLTQGGTLDNYNDNLRITMIVARCEEFHDQFEDDAVIERCREIAGALSVHPDSPLLRGDPVLWSAGIIYAACQDMGLIRRGRSAPPVVEAISRIFGFERASLQNKARALRAFLQD